jgi:hypothetical protein
MCAARFSDVFAFAVHVRFMRTHTINKTAHLTANNTAHMQMAHTSQHTQSHISCADAGFGRCEVFGLLCLQCCVRVRFCMCDMCVRFGKFVVQYVCAVDCSMVCDCVGWFDVCGLVCAV